MLTRQQILCLIKSTRVNAIFTFQVLRDRVVVTEDGPRYVAEILVHTNDSNNISSQHPL